jgi:bifunctional N-acetylglucosamine-1-phosphate-uridyltransferase/glucosamine-1-phosphate-acetyltransferase GlmU-like protein
MADANLAIVVLAAGAGTRMKSATPKLLHKLAGVTIVSHVLATARQLAAAHVVHSCTPPRLNVVPTAVATTVVWPATSGSYVLSAASHTLHAMSPAAEYVPGGHVWMPDPPPGQ